MYEYQDHRPSDVPEQNLPPKVRGSGCDYRGPNTALPLDRRHDTTIYTGECRPSKLISVSGLTITTNVYGKKVSKNTRAIYDSGFYSNPVASQPRTNYVFREPKYISSQVLKINSVSDRTGVERAGDFIRPNGLSW